MVRIIGVTGGTCSGKSSVCKAVAEMYDGVVWVKQDDFFKNESECPKQDGWINWETPESIHYDEMLYALLDLKEGRRTLKPRFSWGGYERKGYEHVGPADIVVVEGFVLFYVEDMLDLFDAKIFMNIPDDVIRERRFSRQPKLDPAYFDQVILPCYKEFCLSTKEHADYVIDADRPIDDVIKDIGEILKPILSS